jgi:hypothetical protein
MAAESASEMNSFTTGKAGRDQEDQNKTKTGVISQRKNVWYICTTNYVDRNNNKTLEKTFVLKCE